MTSHVSTTSIPPQHRAEGVPSDSRVRELRSADAARTPWSRRAAERLLATAGSWHGPVLRITLGAVMLPHGAQKLLGAFEGHGWTGTMGFLTGPIGLPAWLAATVILLEFFAPLALVVGLATRAAALGILAVMVGAIATVHAPNGFFMNWGGDQAGEGFEYHLLVIGMAVALLLVGGGRFAIDRVLARRLASRGGRA